MALLNFANTYAEISGNLTLPLSDTGDYVKLFFSKDGHIISHGKDFTPTFTPTERGLVPLSTGNATDFLRANATWAAITTSDLPMATSVADAISNGITTTTLLSTALIIQYVADLFSANDAMRFKGSIKSTGSNRYETTTADGTMNSFPTKCEVGDTYRILSKGTYAGYTCSVGDMLMCIKDGSGSINSPTYWTAVEANINGTIVHTINGSDYTVYSPNIGETDSFTIFAPVTGGTLKLVLISNGNAAPVWTKQSNLIVGEASKTTHSLSVGIGLAFDIANTYFNGSADRTINLIKATTSTLGGIIVGSNITITDGTISLTKTNVCDALGYVPVERDTWRDIKVAGTSIGNKALNFMPTGDVYVKVGDLVTDTDDYDISFGLSWYNISDNAYEYE